ncbi:MAG: hypothetical protein LBV06_08675 [Propionibacteriaceae bacterium]|nr:hypothetical protein [Propionibacteriaceae bacterium]
MQAVFATGPESSGHAGVTVRLSSGSRNWSFTDDYLFAKFAPQLDAQVRALVEARFPSAIMVYGSNPYAHPTRYPDSFTGQTSFDEFTQAVRSQGYLWIGVFIPDAAADTVTAPSRPVALGGFVVCEIRLAVGQ